MIERCYNKKHTSYKWYGAKGVVVCERWLGVNGFLNFIEDMGLKPSIKHTLDKKNPKLDYFPENCRWATMKEQQNNKTNNVILTHNGESKTQQQWADQLGIKYDKIAWHLKYNNVTITDIIKHIENHGNKRIFFHKRFVV